MIDFQAVFTHGIPTSPDTPQHAMICGAIIVIEPGKVPHTFKFVKGKGDAHNYLFTLGPGQPGDFCYIMTVAPWGPDTPAIEFISMRVMVKDAAGAQRTKILRFQ